LGFFEGLNQVFSVCGASQVYPTNAGESYPQTGDSVTANEPMLKSAVFLGFLRLEKQLQHIGVCI
jgi:hypothetical protein